MKPIIFSTHDVKAILESRKTQVRLVIKPQPIPILPITIDGEVCLSWSHEQPYKSGDILWVRETWTSCATIDSWFDNKNMYIYKTDFQDQKVIWKWRSPIHMPKEAARIFLKVKSIQPERLQDITEEDAIAEGFEPTLCDCVNRGIYGCTDCINTKILEPAIVGFMYTWDESNSKNLWGNNPWVWRIEFERMKEYD